MAKFSLIPYDSHSTTTDITITSEMHFTEDAIHISYKLQGDLESINLESGTPHHARVIKLWEKTCFELFIKNAKNNYIEFNFSPVFEWNCFYFEKKGDTLAEYVRMNSLEVDILLSLDVFHLMVEIDKNKFPEGFFTGEMSAGITSVIKDQNGKISYWALSHEDTRPNFHHFDSFRYKF